jgi:hypothetical protein
VFAGIWEFWTWEFGNFVFADWEFGNWEFSDCEFCVCLELRRLMTCIQTTNKKKINFGFKRQCDDDLPVLLYVVIFGFGRASLDGLR